MYTSFSLLTLISAVIEVALLMFSAIVHEVAHAWTADKLGDPTAREAGRLTLNPLKHIDPFGSIILPLIMVVLRGPVFAYAKPVPYSPYRLRNPGRDDALVAAAGPISNMIQALVGALTFRIIDANVVFTGYTGWFWVLYVLSAYVEVNLSLAFFNILPLPPLDGSKLILPLLHGEARDRYYQIQAYALPILFILLYLLPIIFHVDPLGIYLNFTVDNLSNLLLGA
ncbi:site-2 protease family protein [Atopobium sp. oral taxon 416]|uniref:site-2 protease family protein n=1 Tax=Atopobium sp. oral taxon 416 TaxID=712157 RepID=UPI002012E57C|nr:site-2 protease family protein [Atopobium sp. oral taxon 416]